eukprot:gene5378-3872_t
MKKGAPSTVRGAARHCRPAFFCRAFAVGRVAAARLPLSTGVAVRRHQRIARRMLLGTASDLSAVPEVRLTAQFYPSARHALAISVGDGAPPTHIPQFAAGMGLWVVRLLSADQSLTLVREVLAVLRDGRPAADPETQCDAAAWDLVPAITQVIMEHSAGEQEAVGLIEGLLMRCVTSSVDSASPRVVERMARQLVQLVDDLHGRSRLQDGQAELGRIVPRLLDMAANEFVAPLVLALQVRAPPGAGPLTEDVESVCWHPLVHPTLVLKCYHRIQLAVKAIKQHPALSIYAFVVGDSRRVWPRNTDLLTLHRSVLCAIPNTGCSPAVTAQIATFAMSCLRFARLRDLVVMYTYLTRADPRDITAVQSKFLASCGSITLTTTTALSPGAGADVVRAAFESLAASAAGRVKEVEEGLAHGCAVLRALGDASRVRRVYRELPALRETAHSVAAAMALRDVSGALEALSKLGHSQSSGWVYIPGVVAELLSGLSRLVGRWGTDQHVIDLYKSLAAFRNNGMLISNYMEAVIGGVTDRVLAIPETFPADGGAVPRDVLQDVVPVVEAALRFIGDDVNTDVVLTLLEAAVRCGAFAVPLAVGLTNALRRSAVEHVSLQHLFATGDATTANMAFLPYFTLCVARDFDLAVVFDHLAAVWSANAAAVWSRAASLAPAYKLWRCAGCGRPNSDRFNYCACSALRNGFVCCNNCGYAQDERWPVCLVCGEVSPLHTEQPPRDKVTSIVRKSWVCSECRATNPARQVLLCFRCSKLTGPAAALHGREKAPGTQPPAKESFCGCAFGRRGARTYTNRIGFCHACRAFRNAHSKETSFVWRCCCCHHLRSSLERSCPRCPQIECVPFLYSHAVEEVRFCRHCNAAQSDPFATACSGCGREDVTGDLFHVEAEAAAPPPPAAEDEDSSLRCSACRGQLEDHRQSALCPHCLRFQPPSNLEKDAALADEGVLLETAASLRAAFGSPALPTLSLTGADQFLTALEAASRDGRTRDALRPARPALAAHLSETAALLRPRRGTEPAARRAEAYLRRLLAALDRGCGEVAGGRCDGGEAEGACELCLGSHPALLCGYSPATWTCADCGQESSNTGVSRYVCRGCLALRPIVQQLQPSECWGCGHCGRSNVAFEQYCVFCGVERDSGAVRETATTPFSPARCALCGELFLESSCPSCTPSTRRSIPHNEQPHQHEQQRSPCGLSPVASAVSHIAALSPQHLTPRLCNAAHSGVASASAQRWTRCAFLNPPSQFLTETTSLSSYSPRRLHRMVDYSVRQYNDRAMDPDPHRSYLVSKLLAGPTGELEDSRPLRDLTERIDQFLEVARKTAPVPMESAEGDIGTHVELNVVAGVLEPREPMPGDGVLLPTEQARTALLERQRDEAESLLALWAALTPEGGVVPGASAPLVQECRDVDSSDEDDNVAVMIADDLSSSSDSEGGRCRQRRRISDHGLRFVHHTKTTAGLPKVLSLYCVLLGPIGLAPPLTHTVQYILNKS